MLKNFWLLFYLKTSSRNPIISWLVNNLGPTESLNDAEIEILKEIHQQRFEQVDTAINSLIELFEGQKKEKKNLYSTLSSVFGGSTSEILVGANMTLFLALQHPNKSYRVSAVRRVSDIIKAGECTESQIELLRSVLNNCLHDDPVIATAVLNIKNISSIINADILIASLTNILEEMKTP